MAAWILPAAVAAVNAIGSIFGGKKASDAMRGAQRDIEQRNDENEDLYNRRYNEDATQRADAQRILTLTEDSIRKRNRAAAGVKAVMGGNEASVAAQREINNKATADAASRIAAAGEARKDRIEQNYLNRKQALQDQLTSMKVGRAQNTAQAIQGVTSAASNALMNLGSSNSGGSIWERGNMKNLTQMQRQINDAVAAQRVKDQNAYLQQLGRQAWGG